MIYPTISEYVDAIKMAEDNFDKLSSLRPVTGDDGEPVMSSGNFAVVFKMRDENDGSLHAVKCFLRDQDGRDDSYEQITNELEFVSSNYLCNLKYIKKELFVDTDSSSDNEFPVVFMDWVEGIPLDAYVRQNITDSFALHSLACQFCNLAMWLLTQPFAHGDLKPDNILVRGDGQIVMVDYDGMYVSAMKGSASRELGSPDYRHPSRTSSVFDEHIDDFPLAVIAFSLKAISLNPDLLKEYGSADHLLFTESDYRDLSRCKIMESLHPLMVDSELNRLYALFLIAHSRQELSSVFFQLFAIDKPKKKDFKKIKKEKLSTKVTKEDLENAWTDEYGVKYSKDRKRLLKAPRDIESYDIKPGTIVIGDEAFYDEFPLLKSIHIPNSVTAIGYRAFSWCKLLQSVIIPDSITTIGNSAFSHCSLLQSINIPNSVTTIGDYTFGDCSSLKNINIPNSITEIGSNPFLQCNKLEINCQSSHFIIKNNVLYSKDIKRLISFLSDDTGFDIPDSVTDIDNCAFYCCSSLQSVHIPDSVTAIGDYTFCGCSSLKSINIPDSITTIGDLAFSNSSSLQSINIPYSVKAIGNNPFIGCNNLKINCQSSHFIFKDNVLYSKSMIRLISFLSDFLSGVKNLDIPDSVTTIGNSAFYGCSLQSIHIPDSVTTIENSAFYGCYILQSINIPDSVTTIGDYTLGGCSSLQSIHIPDSVTAIGNYAFSNCSSMQSINISNSVTSIGKWAFASCSSMQSINIPNSVTTIGKEAFYWCFSLQKINIPHGTRAKFEKMLSDYKDNLNEI